VIHSSGGGGQGRREKTVYEMILILLTFESKATHKERHVILIIINWKAGSNGNQKENDS